MSVPCDRCGRLLAEDALRYVVEIQITADVAPNIELDISEEELAAELAAVLEQVSRTSAREAECQVHERLAFVLCPTCRVKFAKDPLGSGPTGGGSLH